MHGQYLLNKSSTRQATFLRARRCSSFFQLFILLEVNIMKMESSRRKWLTSIRLSLMQCRCSLQCHILHSGSQSQLRSLRLASLLQCPTLSFRIFWQTQNLFIVQLSYGAGYFSHSRSTTAPDFDLFWRKLMIWLISLGITFLFQFQCILRLTYFFQLRWGKQSRSPFLIFCCFSFFSFNFQKKLPWSQTFSSQILMAGIV